MRSWIVALVVCLAASLLLQPTSGARLSTTPSPAHNHKIFAPMWHFNSSTGAMMNGNPSVADGSVVFATEDGVLHCLDATDGSKKWHYATGAPLQSGSSPLISGAVVYFGTDAGAAIALAMNDGTPIWTAPVVAAGESFGATTPAFFNETVYFTSTSAMMLYAVSAADGKVRWMAQGYSSPYVDVNKKTVFTGWQSGAMLGYAISGPDEGGQVFDFMDNSISSSFYHPVSNNGLLFFATGSSFVAVDISTNTKEWSSAAASITPANANPLPVLLPSISSVAFAASNQVVAFRQYSATSLAEKAWTFSSRPSAPSLNSNVVLHNTDDVMFVTSSSSLYAIDAGSGVEIASHFSSATLTGGIAALGANAVLVADSTGAVSAWQLVNATVAPSTMIPASQPTAAPPSNNATGILSKWCTDVNCSVNCETVQLKQGCSALGPSTSVFRYCVNSGQTFYSETPYNGTNFCAPNGAQPPRKFPVGACLPAPFGGSFEIVQCHVTP